MKHCSRCRREKPLSSFCPDVSVLMSCYNAANNYPGSWLRRAIKSVMQDQPTVFVEMSITGDGSVDTTDDELRRIHLNIADECNCVPPMLFARHHENMGSAAGFNTAGDMATGRHMIMLSVRSWYEPGCFARMVQYLDNHPEVGFVYGQTQWHGARTGLYVPPPFYAPDFNLHFASMFGFMFRREAWDRGCRFGCSIEAEGQRVDVGDYDFMMQMIHKLGWRGYAMTDTLCLHYELSEDGQMHHLMNRHQDAMVAAFKERWPMFTGKRL